MFTRLHGCLGSASLARLALDILNFRCWVLGRCLVLGIARGQSGGFETG